MEVQSGKADTLHADGGTKTRHLTCQARVPARSLPIKKGDITVVLVLLVDFERNLPWPSFERCFMSAPARGENFRLLK